MFNKTIFRIMAKSKNGGSRAYIRGRIGSDVYSIGKNGKGEKQQVVRSLAETVANPRSQSQMFGRMVMSTVMQAVSAMSQIIDHSFDGIAKGQPSISEFIRTNYALIKADALANPASGNLFGLVKYQEKGSRTGAYIVSKGSVVNPTAFNMIINSGFASIALTADTLTIGGLKAALGFGADDYLTIVGFTAGGSFRFVRLHINPDLADSTAIASGNISSVFVQEGNFAVTVSLDGTSIEVDFSSLSGQAGLITTKKIDGVFQHSTCQITVTAGLNYAADVALPTYPTGNEQFLNGGDI